MTEIPDYILLYGNEDCDVSAQCQRCNPNGGQFAEYGHGLEFDVKNVNGFFNAIIEHCKTHE